MYMQHCLVQLHGCKIPINDYYYCYYYYYYYYYFFFYYYYYKGILPKVCRRIDI